MTHKRPQFINLLAKKFASRVLGVSSPSQARSQGGVEAFAGHVLDHMGELYLVANRLGQIVYANDAMLSLLGATADRVFKIKLQEAFGSVAGGSSLALQMAQVVRDQKPFYGEFQLSREEMRYAGRILPMEGGAQLFLTALDAQAQAIGLGPARGEIGDPHLLSDLSRELHGVVQSVLGASEFLLSPQQNDVDRIDTVRNIRSQVARLGRMAVDLADLAGLVREAPKLHGITLPMDAFFDQMITDWTFIAKERNVAFALSSSTPLPSHFLTDPVRFKQILWDILGFLLAHNESGGLDVRVSCSWPEETKPGRIKFVLRDHVPGKPDHETWRSQRVPADGLGPRELASLEGLGGLWMRVARMVLQAMKGELFVLSAQGLGEGESHAPKVVGFAVEWELNQQAIPGLLTFDEHRKSNATVLPSRRPLDGAQILVVDDSPDAQLGISRMLRLVGAEVQVVGTGVEGLELALTGGWHVVLIDTEVSGGINGYEVVRHLRQAGYELPLLALASKPSTSERRRVLASGFDAYLAKPVDRYTLIEVIAEQLIRSGRASIGRGLELPPSGLLH